MRVVKAPIVAVIVYIIIIELINALITGTTTGDTLIQNVAPIVTAAGVLITILDAFLA